jgi:hypothetical protein
MDAKTIRRLVLPASLAVTTIVACRDPFNAPYCIDLESPDKCNKKDYCRYDEALGECVNICGEFDEQMCLAVDACEWDPGTGESDTGGTGGSTDCHEPFT